MADSDNNGTPLLDELEKGTWPSFVTKIKEMAKEKDECKDLLRLLERSYHEKKPLFPSSFFYPGLPQSPPNRMPHDTFPIQESH